MSRTDQCEQCRSQCGELRRRSDCGVLGAVPFLPSLLVVLCTSILSGVVSSVSLAQPALNGSSVHVLRDGVIRDRRLANAIHLARQYRQEGRQGDFLDAVQSVLDAPHDALIELPGSQPESVRLASAKGEASRLLAESDPEVLRRYEDARGATARGIWLQAIRDKSLDSMLLIVRRYFHTQAGYEAAIHLARRLLDRNEAAASADLMYAVVRAQSHRSRLTASDWTLLSTACVLSGRVPPSDLDLKRVVQPPEAFLQVTMDASRMPWSVASGSVAGPQTAKIAPPLTRRRWSVSPLDGLAMERWVEAIQRWEQREGDRELPDSLPVHAIRIGELIVYRDDFGMTAVDRSTGLLRWRFPFQSRLSNMLVTYRIANDPFAVTQSSYDPQRIPDADLGLAAVIRQHGALSTDGMKIYALDRDDVPAQQAPNRSDDDEFDDPQREFVVAVHIGNPPSRAWTVTDFSGAVRSEGQTRILSHPVPSLQQLFLPIECDGEIQLLELDPETGTIGWRQPVANTSLTVFDSQNQRFRQATINILGSKIMIVSADGTVACMDGIFGRLDWLYLARDRYPAPGARPALRGSMVSHPGFAQSSIVRDDELYLLPPASQHVHCLRCSTGELLWTSPRTGGEFLATVTDKTLVVIGNGTARALRRADGSTEWKTELESPVGVGLALPENYLLPVAGNKFLQIRLRDGLVQPGTYLSADVPLGHLMADRDQVISVHARAISSFVLATVRPNETLPTDHLLAAETLLLRDQPEAAIQRLETALRGVIAADERLLAEHQLRELLFAKAREEPGRKQEYYAKLLPLCESPRQRGQLLIERSFGIPVHELIEVRGTVTADLARLPEDLLWQHPLDRGRKVNADLAIRLISSQVQGAGKSSGVVEPTVEDIVTLLREIRRRDDSSRVALRERVVDRLLELHRYDEAEIALMFTSEATASGRKLRQQVYSALQLDFLARQFDDDTAAWPSTSYATIDFVAHSQESSRRNDRAPGLRPSLRRVHAIPRIRPSGRLGYHVSIQGPNLVVLDHTTLEPIRTIPIGHHLARLRNRFENAKGHGFGVAGPGECRMVSLLQPMDKDLIWSQQPEDLRGRSIEVRAGPVVKGYAIFQARNRLYALDALTGTIVWERTDVSADAGLMMNPDRGIDACGDWLMIYKTGFMEYDLVHIETGVLRRHADSGRKPIYSPTVLGDLVTFVQNSESSRQENRRYAIHAMDVATSEEFLNADLGPRARFVMLNERELAFINAKNQLVFFDASTCRTSTIAGLPELDLANCQRLSVRRDGGIYLVNFQQARPQVETVDHQVPLREFPATTTAVRDSLLAIDAETKDVIWHRPVPFRTILPFENVELPVIITMAEVRNRHDANREHLLIEVIDRQTGLTIGDRSQLPWDAIISVELDAVRREVRLVGERGTYVIRLSP